jgi:hypothetical protein
MNRELYRTQMFKTDGLEVEQIQVLTRATSVDEANEILAVVLAVHEKSDSVCNIKYVAAVN